MTDSGQRLVQLFEDWERRARSQPGHDAWQNALRELRTYLPGIEADARADEHELLIDAESNVALLNEELAAATQWCEEEKAEAIERAARGVQS